jgi:hypothetical protein
LDLIADKDLTDLRLDTDPTASNVLDMDWDKIAEKVAAIQKSWRQAKEIMVKIARLKAALGED